MNRLDWVIHIFIVSRRDAGHATRFYVTKFLLPKDMKKEDCKVIFENILRTVKK